MPALPAGTVMTSEAAPGVVGLSESSTFDGSPLVSVICRLPAGAGSPSDPLRVSCRSLPTITSLMLM